MNAFDVWVSIVLLVMATVLTRCGFFLFGHAIKLPARLRHHAGSGRRQ
jgi:branched-subunit amino acid transport protein